MGFRLAGGVLLALVAVAAAAGGIALRRGDADAWPDLVAGEFVVARTATTLLVIAAAFLVAAAGVLLDQDWALRFSLVVTVVTLLVSLWGTYLLFGDVRPLHAGTNAVLAALICWLVWRGYR